MIVVHSGKGFHFEGYRDVKEALDDVTDVVEYLEKRGITCAEHAREMRVNLLGAGYYRAETCDFCLFDKVEIAEA